MVQIAPQVTVAPPAAREPLHSLIRVGDDLLDLDGDNSLTTPSLGDRWEAGVEYLPECLSPGTILVPCVATDLGITAFGDVAQATPFLVVTGIGCSTFGHQGIDFEGRVERALRASASFQLEQEFWQGSAAQANTLPNNYLSNSSSVTDLNPGAPSTPLLHGFSMMQYSLGRCMLGAPGMIHMSRNVFTLLFSAGVIEKVVESNGTIRYFDSFGNEIVSGTGYDGSGPDGTTDSDGNIFWIYGTGRVGVATSAIVPNEIDVNVATNDVEIYAQQSVVAMWDNCCHLGIALNICNTCCTDVLTPSVEN